MRSQTSKAPMTCNSKYYTERIGNAAKPVMSHPPANGTFTAVAGTDASSSNEKHQHDISVGLIDVCNASLCQIGSSMYVLLLSLTQTGAALLLGDNGSEGCDSGLHMQKQNRIVEVEMDAAEAEAAPALTLAPKASR